MNSGGLVVVKVVYNNVFQTPFFSSFCFHYIFFQIHFIIIVVSTRRLRSCADDVQSQAKSCDRNHEFGA